MNILGIMGSPRKNGNTDILLNNVLIGAEQLGAKTEKVYLSDLNFKGCTGCEGCHKTQKCIITDDMQSVYEKIDQTDGLVLASPTYFYNVSGLMKMFIDRLFTLTEFFMMTNVLFG